MGICCMAQETQMQELCINLEIWGGEGDAKEVQRERIYVYVWLIHVEV